MKFMKYTFRTPLVGSIDCEELLPDTDGRIDLSSEQMCTMYDYHDGQSLMCFLTDRMEDLTACVPEELASVIFRAEFGDFAIRGGKTWLKTYIWTEGSLTEEGVSKVKDWITGQLSDGWGEGLEQEPWRVQRVNKPSVHFDEYYLDFEEGSESVQVGYYMHAWNDEEFYIYLDDVEQVEEDVSYEMVAFVNIPFHTRQVFKIPNELSLRQFFKERGREDLRSAVGMSQLDHVIYMVTDTDGDSGAEILPKWVHETPGCCILVDQSIEDAPVVEEMALSKAITELLI